jgi:glycoside/pentoside/hexuronide:cation symporter, GPH family
VLQRAYYLGGILFTIATCIVIFVQEGQLFLTYAMSTIAGLGVGAALLLPWAMLPDVMSLDELQHGQRREGLFYSFFVFFEKVGLGYG